MLEKLKSSRGFTIIEVVIVLAIAGLIFAVIFVAVPQLQQGQRDSARRNEIARFQAAITQYQANKNGAIPANAFSIATFRNDYMNGDFADPVGGPYTTTTVRNSTSMTPAVIFYRTYRVCHSNGTQETTTGAGPRNYAVLYMLEQGGRQCADNS